MLSGHLHDDVPAPPEDAGLRAHVTTRVVPSGLFFDLRKRMVNGDVDTRLNMLGVAGQLAATPPNMTSTIVTMPYPTVPSYRLSVGDLLFTDDTLDPAVGWAGSGPPLVFSSFAGHSAVLPAGYAVELTRRVSDSAAPDRIERRVVGTPRTAGNRNPPGGANVPLDAGATQRVLQAAYRKRNRSVRFVGVAVTNYVVGDARQDPSGMTAMVSGCASLRNTTGVALHVGDLVGVRLPAEDVPIYTKPLEPRRDPRASLVRIDPAEARKTTLLEDVRDLLYADPGRMKPHVFLGHGGGGGGVGLPHRHDAPADATVDGYGTGWGGTRGPPADDPALALLRLVDAIARWGIEVGARQERGARGGAPIDEAYVDSVMYSQPGQVQLPSQVAAGHEDYEVNLARAHFARLLDMAPPDGSPLHGALDGLAPYHDRPPTENELHVVGGLPAALATLDVRARPVPRARVVRGGMPDQAVDLMFFA